MAKLTVIYWRDIPSQVKAKKGRKNAKALLTNRFMEAIDRAAMRAGRATTDEYLEDWHNREMECDDNIDAAVSTEAERLEAAFSDQDLEAMVSNKGYQVTDAE